MKKRGLFVCVSALIALLFLCPTAFAAAAGDVDANGKTEAADARLALRAAVSLDRLTGETWHVADVDANGKIEAADARLILRMAVGLQNAPKTVSAHRWVTTAETPSDCRAAGSRNETCSLCGETRTAIIPLAAHSWTTGSVVPEKAPSCTENGHIAYWVCGVCGKTFADAAGTREVSDTTLKATGHGYGAWERLDGTLHRRVCANDPTHTETEAHAWDAGTVTVPASCTAGGEMRFTCSVCGAVRTGKTELLPHTPALVPAKSPTCTENGNIAYYACTVCGKTFTDAAGETELPDPTLKPMGHVYGVWEKLDDTQHRRVCANDPSHTEAEAHVWDAGTVTVPASCTEDGVRTYTCAVCRGTRTEPIPSRHDFSSAGTDPDAPLVCAVCGKTIPSFNALVNVLKTESSYYTGFTKEKSSGEVISSKFSPSSMEKLFGEELKSGLFDDKDEYRDRMSSPWPIRNYSFEVAGKDYVSGLTAGDLVSLRAEETQGVDFLAALPDTIPFTERGTVVESDITALKSTPVGKVLKIEATLRQERYSELKNSTAESALQRATDVDIRALAAYSKMSQTEDVELGNLTIGMDCTEIVSDCVVTYYFDAETLRPLAAVYGVGLDMTENTTMKLVGKRLGITLVSGVIDFRVRTDTTKYYFFDSRFVQS